MPRDSESSRRFPRSCGVGRPHRNQSEGPSCLERRPPEGKDGRQRCSAGQDSDGIDGQVVFDPIESEIFQHAPGQVGIRLCLVFEVDEEPGAFSAEAGLDQEVSGPALSTAGK